MQNETENNSNMGSAILAALGGVFSSIGNIWTSSNQVKAEKLAIQKLEAEKENAADLLKQNSLIEALKTKQVALSAAVAKDKANANIRALVYVLLAALVAFFGFRFFGKKKTASE